MVCRIAVPRPEDRVAGRRPVRVTQFDDAPDADRLGRDVLEIGDAGPCEVALERPLLGHEDLLVLLRHLVFGILAQIAVLARRRDRARILRDLLRDDGLILLAPAVVACARNEELLLAALAIACDKGLDVGEDLDEAGQERLFRKLLETLVQQESVCQIARGLGVGRREEVPDQVRIIAQDVGERDAAGACGLERLVVDSEE